MDILSVRKRKQGEAKTTPPSPAAAPPAAATPTATTLPTTTLPTTTLSTTTLPTTTLPAPGETPPRRHGERDDPLTGFLAAYDDVGEDADNAGSVRVATADDAERYLSFVLAGEAYAASIMDVREILKIRSLTDVPRAPKGVLGVISKRGTVLPVVDLATALSLRAPDRRLRVNQRVLVVGDGDRACGLRVDAVSEVIKLKADTIEGVPASVGIKNAGLLAGLGRANGAMYILLDLAAVLDSFAASVGLSPMTPSVPR